MRPLLLALCLLLAAPAGAEDKTVQLRLQHAPAAEVERFLATGVARQPVEGEVPAPRGGRGLFPEGIVAWTADPGSNSLWLTGSEAAIEEVREIVRLVDVRPRRLRLAVRAFAVDEATRRSLKQTASVEHGTFLAAFADATQIQRLREKPPLAMVTLAVSNNHPLAMRLPWQKGEPPVLAMVTPRMNGDGSVTLSVVHAGVRAIEGSPVRDTPLVQRVLPGQGLALVSETGVGWLVVFEEALPEERADKR